MERFGSFIYSYFLSKFKKHTRMYRIHSGSQSKDLQKFMQECMNDSVLLDKALEFQSEDDFDRRVVDILRYVKKRTTYISDSVIWKVPEWWQTAKTTYDKRTGDCEDGSILIITLARLSGIPENRIFVNAGYVNYRNRKIGHAYVTYLGNDGAEYILDWSYFYDGRRIPTRKRNWYDDRYLMPRWFFGNDQGFYKNY